MITNIMIIKIVICEQNLCELIEDVNSDKITGQLKVAQVCTKSIPENNCDDITYSEILCMKIT